MMNLPPFIARAASRYVAILGSVIVHLTLSDYLHIGGFITVQSGFPHHGKKKC